MTRSEPTTPKRGQYIHANGVDIYYEDYGQGTPLLLLHGGALTAESWQLYLAGFSEQYRVIAPDSRGHGRTANPLGQMSYRLLADDMVAFVEALGITKPMICGFSDGGQIALEIGMRYPDLPQSLVLAGTLFKFSKEYLASVRKLFGDEQSVGVDAERFQQENPEWVASLQATHGAERWKDLLNEIKPMWMTPLNYTQADFARVVAPTLVMLGDRDFVPVEEAVEMYRLLPNAELAILPGADHMSFVEAKAALAQTLILEFLAQHVTE